MEKYLEEMIADKQISIKSTNGCIAEFQKKNVETNNEIDALLNIVRFTSGSIAKEEFAIINAKYKGLCNSISKNNSFMQSWQEDVIKMESEIFHLENLRGKIKDRQGSAEIYD